MASRPVSRKQQPTGKTPAGNGEGKATQGHDKATRDKAAQRTASARNRALEIRDDLGRQIRAHREGSGISLREFARRLDDLVAALFVEDTFPYGVILSTGTALVPDTPFTLEAGDDVEIEIDSLGTLRNSVVRGKARRI